MLEVSKLGNTRIEILVGYYELTIVGRRLRELTIIELTLSPICLVRSHSKIGALRVMVVGQWLALL